MNSDVFVLACAVLLGCGGNPYWECPSTHLRVHDAVSGLLVADAKVVLSADWGRLDIEATADGLSIRQLPELGEYIVFIGGAGQEVVVTHPGYVSQRVPTAPYTHCLVYGDAAVGQSPYWSDRYYHGVRMTAMDVWLVRQ